MIGIEGQYVFKFSIDDLQDFIEHGDIQEFTMIESAGNILPTFELTFTSSKNNLPRYINEGAGLKVWYGLNRDKLTEANLIITSYSIRRFGSGLRGYSLKGLATKKEYINNTSNRVITSSGIEAINTVVSSYFTLESNIDSSSDSQSWIQYNNIDKNFVNQIWLHTDLGSSFPVIGITADSKFILKDVKKLLGTTPVWKFTDNISKKDKTKIAYDEYLVKSNAGFINSWVGYGRKAPTLDIETSTDGVNEITVEPLIALSKYIDRKSTLNSKYNELAPLNDNVHSNYVKSYYHNLTHLAVFSSQRVQLFYSNQYKNTKLLDLVHFEDIEIGTNRKQISEYHTGLYLISKVSRTLVQNSFITTIELCRETHNSSKGSLR